MEEKTIRRIEEEHKSQNPDTLRNAELINIAGAYVQFQSKIERLYEAKI